MNDEELSILNLVCYEGSIIHGPIVFSKWVFGIFLVVFLIFTFPDPYDGKFLNNFELKTSWLRRLISF